jgi:hypothetical protein
LQGRRPGSRRPDDDVARAHRQISTEDVEDLVGVGRDDVVRERGEHEVTAVGTEPRTELAEFAAPPPESTLARVMQRQDQRQKG